MNEINEIINELKTIYNNGICIDDTEYKQIGNLLQLQPWERNLYVAYRLAPNKSKFFASIGIARSTGNKYIKEIKQKIYGK